MPPKSKAQVAYLGMHHPEVLRKWKAEGASTSTKGLPEHVAKTKKAAAKEHRHGRKRRRRRKSPHNSPASSDTRGSTTKTPPNTSRY